MKQYFVSLLSGAVLNYTNMIVLAGQSNMDGRAKLADIPIEYAYMNTPTPSIKIFDAQSGDNEWETMTPGVNSQNRQSYTQFGPELSLSKSLSKDYFFVKFAVGGSILANDTYVNGTWNINRTEHYSTLKTRYSAAKQKLIDDGKQNIRVKYFIWLQGETDANTLSYANAYEDNLIALINDFKSFTGYNFKTIVVRIKYPAGTYINTVKAAQDAIPNSVPKTTVIDTDSLSMLVDGLHYDEQGQIDLGQLIANMMEP